jgi:hypothetical protein
VSPGRHAQKRSRGPALIGVAALAVAAAGVTVAATRAIGSSSTAATGTTHVKTALGPTLLDDRFGGPDGLVTNEYAYENEGSGTQSPTWLVTSGSLFRRDGVAWSGRPDTLAPGPDSATATNSDVFRMVTRRQDFGDVRVSVQFQVVRFDDRGPRDAFDGMHVFLRYRSDASLLVVSVCRRDNMAAVKKKVAGGTTNGGTYYLLASANNACSTGQWHSADVDVRNVADGVAIDVSVDGRHVLTAHDSGTGGPAMRDPGRVGIRADYIEFLVRRFTVRKL